jgi:hypothetical protein
VTNGSRPSLHASLTLAWVGTMITLVLALYPWNPGLSLTDPGIIAQGAAPPGQSQPNTRASPQTERVRIKSLKLQVTTRKDRGAGTDNAVYFDIGPLAWRLNKSWHNDFERGRTDTYNLPLPSGVVLSSDDILWLRLHKKGIIGATGTGDGFDGAWHPQSILLIVNGVPYPPVEITKPLNSRCWYWRSQDPDDRDPELFARSLRMLPNKRLNTFDKMSGGVTTSLFKKHGISGWLLNSVQRECRGLSQQGESNVKIPPMCVTGEVIAKRKSTDGIETIDLKVASLEAYLEGESKPAREISLDGAHGFVQVRYLRVENRYAHKPLPNGAVARICGNVRWDTDREGWWEIHPRDSADVQPASK